MNAVNRLGVRVAITTVGGLLVIYGIYWGASRLISSLQPEPAATPTPSPTELTITDFDQDGLSDLVENVYQTNARAADTDGDGTQDGAEVAAGRDPVKKGPDDALADVPLAKQVIDTSTYTGQYLASLPADLNRNDILDKVRLEAFIATHRDKLLPDIPVGTIKVSSATGKEAITKYLDQISSSTNLAIKPVSSSDIDAAFRAAYQDPKSPTLEEIGEVVAANYAALAAVEAPKEVVALHTKLVAATQALLNNIKLLQTMPTDFVGGLIGAKNVEDLAPVFQDISKQIEKLEA